jgi:hypothetical protein
VRVQELARGVDERVEFHVAAEELDAVRAVVQALLEGRSGPREHPGHLLFVHAADVRRHGHPPAAVVLLLLDLGGGAAGGGARWLQARGTARAARSRDEER